MSTTLDTALVPDTALVAPPGSRRMRWAQTLAVVRIEGARAGATVIGEDLGTVAEEVRAALRPMKGSRRPAGRRRRERPTMNKSELVADGKALLVEVVVAGEPRRAEMTNGRTSFVVPMDAVDEIDPDGRVLAEPLSR